MRQIALLSIVAVLLMGGCHATRNPPATAPVTPPVTVPPVTVSEPESVAMITPHIETRTDSISDGLLKYFSYVRKLQTAELAKEHDAARQLYAAARTDFNRVRYAMLLSIPGAPFSDDTRALDALDPLLKNQNSVLYGVAYMLNATIQEQRRSYGLQQKLDALRSLEKDLLQRDGVKRK